MGEGRAEVKAGQPEPFHQAKHFKTVMTGLDPVIRVSPRTENIKVRDRPAAIASVTRRVL
jgi:hypothetical protein